ncbi:MAG TPA: class I SAM-dependent methyltransferase [Actinomycetota bacterium]|nr:class I SAM-dependent methyltransferase [Actinomycetota bacterium]
MWDERYTESDQMWSGEPNGALVAEVQGRSPGRALDVGCGEGADAIWLAQQGWDVTALDVSGVALERARAVAKEAGADVRWLHAGLLEAALPAGAYDLVSAQYPALLRTPGNRAGRALLDAVAPGGTLLFVHHAHFGSQSADGVAGGQPDGDSDRDGHVSHEGHGEHGNHGDGEHDPGFDPEDFVGPADIAALLGAGWRVEVDEQRPREVSGGAGAGHSEDVVLRAVRLV